MLTRTLHMEMANILAKRMHVHASVMGIEKPQKIFSTYFHFNFAEIYT